MSRRILIIQGHPDAAVPHLVETQDEVARAKWLRKLGECGRKAD
jgi:hypothetical protein